MWGIWDLARATWVFEPPSSQNYGGSAVLAFHARKQAEKRAASFSGFDTYAEAKENGWCEVRQLESDSPVCVYCGCPATFNEMTASGDIARVNDLPYHHVPLCGTHADTRNRYLRNGSDSLFIKIEKEVESDGR